MQRTRFGTYKGMKCMARFDGDVVKISTMELEDFVTLADNENLEFFTPNDDVVSRQRFWDDVFLGIISSGLVVMTDDAKRVADNALKLRDKRWVSDS